MADATAPETGHKPAEIVKEQHSSSKTRLASLDALRGFDMFWIVGAEEIVHGLSRISEGGVVGVMSKQLKHVSWEGFVFYDLIFPLFVFMVGIGVVFSLPKMLEKEGTKATYIRIVRRFILLFLLGALYDGGWAELPGENPLVGVLQRIAFCYLFTSILFINFKRRGLIIAFLVLIIGYWAMMTFVPAPGMDHVSFEKKENIANWIDYKFLPNKEPGQYYDPEGIAPTFPAVGTCLLGVFAGLLLIERSLTDRRKAAYLLGAGVIMVLLGYLWGLQFPVIKRLWTSSYVLVAGGYSCILLSAFYWIVDIKGWSLWTRPFVWIGANSLTMYLAWELIPFARSIEGIKRPGEASEVLFPSLADRFVGGPLRAYYGDYSDFVLACVGLLLIILVARFMYKRQIFIRV